ncbi:MAG TPA: ATP-binding protein [Polyangiales bacterium]|nr:ATP-binding protein [Polyangiales bacterium]
MTRDAWGWLGDGGGEAAGIIRGVDWASTAVGSVESWPPELKSVVSMMLYARHPMFLWWGPELIQFYNDGYTPSFGVGRHPAAMGQRGRECWSEIWPVIGPEIDGVIARREGTFHEDALVPIFRNGRMEEVYWTYGYSPVFDARGEVAGVLVVVTETTTRVWTLRRQSTARRLVDTLSLAENQDDLAQRAVHVLQDAPEDVAWAIAVDSLNGTLLASTRNLSAVRAADVIACVRTTEGALELEPWDVPVAGLPGGPWPEPSTRAVVVHLRPPTDATPQGLLIVGLSPRLPYDRFYEEYILDVSRLLHEAAQRIAARVDSERTAVEREELVRELRAASRSKDEFVAMLGHELRNPIAPIATALSLLEMREIKGIDRERAVIARQVRHLTRLVDDLLDVARLASNKVKLSLELVDLSQLAMQALELATPLMEERAQRVRVEVPPGFQVCVDEGRLTQVLANLLTNASKYSNADSEIVIRAERRGDQVAISVRDSGIGIDEEMLPRVFDMFSQERQSLARSSGGLGLGLAIVRNLVRMHGGTVSAESKGRDQGSTFTVVLPLCEEPGASQPKLDDAAGARSSNEVRRILIVDDNEDAAELLAAILGDLGHETRVAADGPTAISLIDQFAPDVALLDIGLPVMDGYELAQHLRVRAGARLQMYALTGYGQADDRERARAAGFDGHFVKPLDLTTLMRAIDQRQSW